MVKVKKEPGIFINQRTTKSEKTPFLLACGSGETDAIKWVASQPGVDFKVVSKKGVNAFHEAVLSGSVEAMEYVLKMMAKDAEGRREYLNSPGSNQMRPLSYAADVGEAEGVRWLLGNLSLSLSRKYGNK